MDASESENHCNDGEDPEDVDETEGLIVTNETTMRLRMGPGPGRDGEAGGMNGKGTRHRSGCGRKSDLNADGGMCRCSNRGLGSDGGGGRGCRLGSRSGTRSWSCGRRHRQH